LKETSQPLDFSNKLPKSSRYPTNAKTEDKAYTFVRQDFEETNSFTVVTGFSSLDFIIKFFGNEILENLHIEIVLGFEENLSGNSSNLKKYPKNNFSKEIIDYWISKGIDIFSCGQVIRLIEFLKNDNPLNRRFSMRIHKNLHGKIYVSDNFAMLGSSNFSGSGLRILNEANIRIGKIEDEDTYKEIKQIANYYFGQGTDFNDELVNLLSKLIRFVTWEHALARAISEIEKWAENLPNFSQKLNELKNPLWGTQKEAIGKILYLLDNVGNVLIADPTGSGKTRLAVALYCCLQNRFNNRSNFSNQNSLVICPPQVVEDWKKEFREFKTDFENVESQGLLKNSNSQNSLKIAEKIKNAQILFIDEAHNYLNEDTGRSEMLSQNIANEIFLFTATPINKRIDDIVRLIEILGVDNLTDEAIKEFERIDKLIKKGKRIAENDEDILKDMLQNFMLRRTKRELNKKIEKNPDSYKNASGINCKYPKQRLKTYLIKNSEKDEKLANEINDLLTNESYSFLGLVNLRKIYLTKESFVSEESQIREWKLRKSAAKGLEKYRIQSSLRSSTAALIEYLEGTLKAIQFCSERGFPISDTFKKDKGTGNILSKIKLFKDLPQHNFKLKNLEGGDWLFDSTKYAEVCKNEIAIYNLILEKAYKISLNREQSKAGFLINRYEKDSLVLAFDNKIISLHLIESIIKKKSNKIPNILLVTGSLQSSKKKAKEIFGLKSTENHHIGLFSDSMSESINLPKAKTIVFLDVPSVMRITEQRIGRIDRMNSPHALINVFFPNDSEAFVLKTDRRFLKTAKLVHKTIGGNLETEDLKEMFERWDEEPISGNTYIKILKGEQEKYNNSFEDGLQDAFGSINKLVINDDKSESEGLVSQTIYEDIKRTTASIQTAVGVDISKIESSGIPWGFFCLKNTQGLAPYWVYLDEHEINEKRIIISLSEISKLLISKNLPLSNNIEPKDQLDQTENLLRLFTVHIQKYEILRLSNKKRRAVNLLLNVIDDILKVSKKKKIDIRREKCLNELKKIINSNDEQQEFSLNFDSLAISWLKIVNPHLEEEKRRQKENRKRSKNIIHLGIMRDIFNKIELPTEDFEYLLNNLERVEPIKDRIISCIIGIPVLE
jgi:superfamily II DNA or RNA helicase